MVQSLVFVALQTQGQTALVRIFELLAASADELEAARKRGMWAGHKDAERFWTEKRPHVSAAIEDLWLEFWKGIDRPVPQQK
jgi:hypothetical protein